MKVQIPPFLDKVPQYVAVVTAVLYSMGFVVVNTSLSHYGHSDLEILNARFLLTGFLCAAYFFFWWWGAGDYANYIDSLAEDFSAIRSIDIGLYRVLFFQVVIVTLIFRLIVGAAVFSAFTFSDVDFFDPSILGLLLSERFIRLVFDTFSKRLSKLSVLSESLVQIAIMALFFEITADEVRAIVLQYFAIFVVYTVGYKIWISKILSERISGTGYMVFVVLGLVILFSTQDFSKIKQEYGGGAGSNVEVYVKSPLPFTSLKNGTSSFTAKQIYVGNKGYLFQLSDRSLFLPSDQVLATIGSPEAKVANPYMRFWNRLKMRGLVK